MKIKFDQYKFVGSKVGNVPIHIKKLPWANGWVEIRVLVHVGAINDPRNKEGLAHFFEHLPFDGTTKFPSLEKMETISRKIFMNTLNAYTGFTKTVYEGKVLTKNINEAIEVFEEMLVRPLLLDKDIERERLIITQEIWDRYNNPKRQQLFRDLNKKIYGDHVYGRQLFPFGWSDTLKNISGEDIRKFHKENYHDGNIEIVLVGDISLKQAKLAIKKMVDSLPKGTKNPRIIPHDKFNPPEERNIKISAKKYFGISEESAPKQTEIRIVRLVETIKNHAIWKIANTIIYQMLYEDLRGKLGAIYSPRVSLDRNLGHDTWDLFISVDPSKAEEAINVIKSVLNKFINGNPKDKYLKTKFEETKKMYIEGICTMESSASDIAYHSTEDISRFEKIVTANECLKNRKGVKLKDIISLIKKELAEDKLFWFVQEP